MAGGGLIEEGVGVISFQAKEGLCGLRSAAWPRSDALGNDKVFDFLFHPRLIFGSPS